MGEVGAMRTTLRLLQGETLGFVEEVQSIYGITPVWTEETVFEETQKVLDELIPGRGSLADRMQTYREQFQISTEIAAPIINRLVEDLRARARGRFSLPTDETCDFEFVTDEPWAAYNWYLGNYKSRIDFNLDLPMRAYALPYFIAHEAYPGHHTEHSIKEQRHYREDGLLEHSILLNNAPSAVISEGIAECGIEMIFSPEELVEVHQWILEEAGLSEYSGRLIYEISHVASRPLGKVSDNKLLLLHVNGASDDEVISYGKRYGLTSEEQGIKNLQFAKDPMWRSYGFNYTLGYELISRLLATARDRNQMFARLLSEPMTPAQVQRLASQ